jgi:hypothetical protein
MLVYGSFPYAYIPNVLIQKSFSGAKSKLFAVQFSYFR